MKDVSAPRRRMRVPNLLDMKQAGEKITMLTAYDATMARLLDSAGIDVLLVGDSLGMVIVGEETTVGVDMRAMVHHTRAVANGTAHALVVADMPFLTYQASVASAVRNARRLIQAGAGAVKLEGGAAIIPAVRTLTSAGVPVMGHVGLIPQSVHKLGGFRSVGKTDAEAEQLFADAHALSDAGAFALVLESIPAEVAERITREIPVPTIGIGAGSHCDGQVLVSYDAFGLYNDFTPRFVKRFAELGTMMTEAARDYIAEVRAGAFPAEEHSIHARPAHAVKA